MWVLIRTTEQTVLTISYNLQFLYLKQKYCQRIPTLIFEYSCGYSNNIRIFDGEIDLFCTTNIRKVISCIFKGGFYCKNTNDNKKNLLYSKIMKLPKYYSCCIYFFLTFFCIIIDSIYFSEDMPCNDFGHVDNSLTFNQPKTFCI